MTSIMNCINGGNNRKGYDVIPEHPLQRLKPMRDNKEARRRTFNSWPNNSFISADELCDDGFYYMGMQDKVQCAYCGGVLSGWEKGDDVHYEHARHFSDCPFLRIRDIEADNLSTSDIEEDSVPGRDSEHTRTARTIDPNQADNAGHPSSNRPELFGSSLMKDTSDSNSKVVKIDLRYPEYSLFNKRLETFESWPSDHFLKPEDLADAALFYKGNSDSCQCYVCGLVLEEWEKGDVPKEEHKKWNPKCSTLTN